MNTAIWLVVVIIGTVAIGALCLLLIWSSVIINRIKHGSWVISKAVWWFTGGVCIGLLGPFVDSKLPYQVKTDYAAFFILVFLSASVISLSISNIMARRYPSAGSTFVVIGSIVLLTIDCLGFIGMMIG
jgi:hypothetical protein